MKSLVPIYFVSVLITFSQAECAPVPVEGTEVSGVSHPDGSQTLNETKRGQGDATNNSGPLFDLIGGADAVRRAQERHAARNRGLKNLELVFYDFQSTITGHRGDELERLSAAGMSREKLIALEVTFNRETAENDRRKEEAHKLVFCVAITPEALRAEEQATKLREDIARFHDDLIDPEGKLLEEEAMDLSQRVEELFKVLPSLPKLTPEQAQKEADQISDDELLRSPL